MSAVFRLLGAVSLAVFAGVFNPLARRPAYLPLFRPGGWAVLDGLIYGFFLLVLASVGIFFVMAISAFRSYIKGPQAKKTPVETMRCFLDGVIHTIIGNTGQSWMCLSLASRAKFGDVRNFSKQWHAHVTSRENQVESKVVTSNKDRRNISFSMKTVEMVEQEGNFAVVRAILVAERKYTWEDIRVLAKVGQRWYLVDGSCYEDVPTPLQQYRSAIAEKSRGPGPIGQKGD